MIDTSPHEDPSDSADGVPEDGTPTTPTGDTTTQDTQEPIRTPATITEATQDTIPRTGDELKEAMATLVGKTILALTKQADAGTINPTGVAAVARLCKQLRIDVSSLSSTRRQRPEGIRPYDAEAAEHQQQLQNALHTPFWQQARDEL